MSLWKMFSSLETVIKIALDEAVLTIWDTRIIYFSYSNMRMVLFSFLHARNHWEIAMEMRKTVFCIDLLIGISQRYKDVLRFYSSTRSLYTKRQESQCGIILCFSIGTFSKIRGLRTEYFLNTAEKVSQCFPSLLLNQIVNTETAVVRNQDRHKLSFMKKNFNNGQKEKKNI